MRKIEREMIQAIVDRRGWHKSNTMVKVHSPHHVEVLLHGNSIASYYSDGAGVLELRHCGWTTPTTKSRLNAICQFVTGSACVFQRDFDWFVKLPNGSTVPFIDEVLVWMMTICGLT